MISFKDVFHWSDPKLFSIDSPIRKVFVLFVVVLANLLIGVESFGVTLSIYDIQGYFAIDDTRRSWISVLLFIGIAIPTPIFTYFSNRYTKKVCYTIGLSLLIFGCFICGISTSYYELLAGRLITGIGAGFIFSCTVFIIKRMVKPQFHGAALTLNTYMSFGLGVALALLAGGVIGQSAHWRLAFFIDVFIGIVCLLLLWISFKEVADTLTEKVPVDFLEYIYFLGLLGSLAIFFSQVKAPWNTLGWRSTFSLIFVFLIVLFLILLIVRYEKVKVPLFPFFLFKYKNLTLACIGIMILGMLMFGGVTQLIYTLRTAFQYEYITIGLVLSVFGFSLFAFGMLTLFMKTIPPVYFILVGFSLIALSCFINHALTFQTEPKDIIFFLFLRGAGMGLAWQPLLVFSLQSIPQEEGEHAGRLIGSCQQIIGGTASSIISTMTVMREAFHNLRYGEQVDIYGAHVQNFLRSWQIRMEDVTGQSDYLATIKAKNYLTSNIKIQSHIASFDDVFFVIGWVSVVFIVVLGVSSFYSWLREEKALKA
ncbi:MAG: MFS transporter [Chlamydiota bacterium]